ncbi:hypothetical protein HA44_16975 [Mixta gaviniae]|nr:hypothetical protein HA44_16975 [Mixta gaviniae]
MAFLPGGNKGKVYPSGGAATIYHHGAEIYHHGAVMFCVFFVLSLSDCDLNYIFIRHRLTWQHEKKASRRGEGMRRVTNQIFLSDN